ncbi:MAG: flagellar hook-basal body complex protein, partial [Thermodesulfobacteriota bacterium]|nr:flagellar hook-basal body complex protein [Thermodesulfobacteriota bacterium]
YWEYIVTIDPAEDKRSYYNGAAWVDMDTTSAAGVMMIGTLKFDSAGQLKDMNAFTLAASNAAGGPGLLSNWKATAINTDGYVTFDPNFSGQSNAGFVVTTAGDKMYLSDAHPIAMDFGLNTTLKDWPWAETAFAAATYDASDVGVDATNNIGFGSKYVDFEAFATTSFSGSSSTLFQSQDGYTFGFLQNVTVDRDGILAGRYSNGIVKELYEIQLYDFVNKWGLRREGSNLFSETLASGLSKNDAPNQIGMGSIASNSLEQSNVDMAAEFVDMITTERGFQANSKVITTTDQMLQQVIMMKR